MKQNKKSACLKTDRRENIPFSNEFRVRVSHQCLFSSARIECVFLLHNADLMEIILYGLIPIEAVILVKSDD